MAGGQRGTVVLGDVDLAGAGELDNTFHEGLRGVGLST